MFTRDEGAAARGIVTSLHALAVVFLLDGSPPACCVVLNGDSLVCSSEFVLGVVSCKFMGIHSVLTE